jgi:hypothetical protein
MDKLIHFFHNTALDTPYTLQVLEHHPEEIRFLDRRWTLVEDQQTGENLGHPIGSLHISELPEDFATQGIDIDGTGAWRISPASGRNCIHALESARILPHNV